MSIRTDASSSSDNKGLGNLYQRRTINQSLTGSIPLRRPDRGAVPGHYVREPQRKPLRATGVSNDVLFEGADREVAVGDSVRGGATGMRARPGGKAVAVVGVRLVGRCVVESEIESGQRGG